MHLVSGGDAGAEVYGDEELLVTALQWISQYEAWVIESRGLAYRRRCLAEWNTTIIPADQAVGRWQALQRECEILLKESE